MRLHFKFDEEKNPVEFFDYELRDSNREPFFLPSLHGLIDHIDLILIARHD